MNQPRRMTLFILLGIGWNYFGVQFSNAPGFDTHSDGRIEFSIARAAAPKAIFRRHIRCPHGNDWKRKYLGGNANGRRDTRCILRLSNNFP